MQQKSWQIFGPEIERTFHRRQSRQRRKKKEQELISQEINMDPPVEEPQNNQSPCRNGLNNGAPAADAAGIQNPIFIAEDRDRALRDYAGATSQNMALESLIRASRPLILN